MYSVEVHMYADDIRLLVLISVEECDSAVTKVEACIAEMKSVLAVNHLKLNDEKTEFLVMDQKQLLNRIGKDQSIVIGSSMIHVSQFAKKTLVICYTLILT